MTGLVNGGSYSYYVRCQDTAGNPNTNDFTISFSVAGGTRAHQQLLRDRESCCRKAAIWDTPGSMGRAAQEQWGLFVDSLAQARLVTPTIGADQYSEITYDQDPGASAWAGVATRVQGASNGSGYLAIAYAGEVRLYRTEIRVR